MTQLSIESVLADFARRRPELARFTSKIELLLRELLHAKGIDYHLIESRTKESSSLKEKISRSSKSYRDPLAEITDLCGLRIITYYQDHADAIGRLIQSEFRVDERHSLIHSSSGAEFGYKSSHFVVLLNEQRSRLLEWNGLGHLCAEIQVRTVLQHAWAAISHKLQYKREEDVPLALKRKLFRLSALFELADDEFVSLRDASGEVRKEISEQISTGTHLVPLDSISLRELISSSSSVADLCDMAETAGFEFDMAEEGDDQDDHDRVSDLLHLAKIADLGTVQKFEAMLKNSLSWAQAYLIAQYEADQRADSAAWYVTNSFVCELILIKTHVNTIRLRHLLDIGYSRPIGTRVYEVPGDSPAGCRRPLRARPSCRPATVALPPGAGRTRSHLPLVPSCRAGGPLPHPSPSKRPGGPSSTCPLHR